VRGADEGAGMSGSEFGSDYAGRYDVLYQDKDYERECDMLADVFARFADGPVTTVLDIGCGTGNHSLPLARRGFAMTGVDRSPAMLEQASRKAAAAPIGAIAPTFRDGDARTLDLKQTFDAALMMFAVLGYQLTNDHVASALAAVRRHLKPGGVFVFDVWYGPAVLSIRPGERVKTLATPDGTVIRSASTKMDTFRHLAEVRYQMWHVRASGPMVETTESHSMRYFFPQELAFFLSQAGFALRHLSDFGSLDRQADESTWNVLGIAEAIE
jgi:SAM-dependent methyltransferase